MDLIDWLNFAVFLNSWNLSSHELLRAHEDGSHSQTWHIVDSLLEKYIMEKISSLESSICYPMVDLPVLVQLVTEPLAWHGLVIQSCVRSSLPSGKKKKKTGPSDLSSLSYLRHSVQSLCDMVEKVINWVREQINRSEDENLEFLLSSVQKKGQEGPGQVFQILEALVSSINDIDFGDRISQALKSWNPVDVARKIVTGKRSVFAEFLRICESKFKMLQSLKQQVFQF